MRFGMRSLLAVWLMMSLASCQSKKQDEGSQPETSVAVEQPTPVPVLEAEPAPAPDEPYYPPAPDLPPAPDVIRIAVISDVNNSYGSTTYLPTVNTAVQDIIRRKANIVLSPGDLIAGQKPGLDYAAMWRAFHFNIGDVFFDNDIEFIWAPGNHDCSAYEGFENERVECRKAWASRLPKAELLPGSDFPFHYAVIIRDILIVALDATRPFAMGESQLDWLESTLRAHKDVRASIVLGHMPLEPVRYAQYWEVAGSPRLIQILKDEGVTFYISGHHHVFYPGHLGELRTIFMPALGANPRTFSNQDNPRGGYVMIDIPSEGPATVQALVSPDFTRMIDIKSLPVNLIKIEREDLGMANYIIELLDRQL